jgi:hypothetical protein
MTVKEAAQLVGKDERTIKRWKAQGLSLDNPDEVQEWSNRKDANSKGKTRSLALERRGGNSQEAVTAGVTAAVTPDTDLPKPGDIGAAHALHRLQLAEKSAHSRWEAIKATGDLLAISEAEQSWLRLSNALRHYENQVALAARDSGDLMPRATAEATIRYAIRLLRLAVKRWLSCEIPNLCAETVPHVMEQKILAGISNFTASSWKDSKNNRDPIPEWALPILVEEWPGPVSQ